MSSAATSSTTATLSVIFSPVIASQFKHVQTFHNLMALWTANPLQVPFARLWVKALTGVDTFCNTTAHQMVVQQVEGAKRKYPAMFAAARCTPSSLAKVSGGGSNEVSSRRPKSGGASASSASNPSSGMMAHSAFPTDSQQLEEALVWLLSSTYLCVSPAVTKTVALWQQHDDEGDSNGSATATTATVEHVHRSGGGGGGELHHDQQQGTEIALHLTSTPAELNAALPSSGPRPKPPRPKSSPSTWRSHKSAAPLERSSASVSQAPPPTDPNDPNALKHHLEMHTEASEPSSIADAGPAVTGNSNAAAHAVSLRTGHDGKTFVDLNIARAVCRPGGNTIAAPPPPIIGVVQEVLRGHEAHAVAAAEARSQMQTAAVESIFSVEQMKLVKKRMEQSTMHQRRQETMLEELRSPRSTERSLRAPGAVTTVATMNAKETTETGTAVAAASPRRPHTAGSVSSRSAILGSLSHRAMPVTAVLEPNAASAAVVGGRVGAGKPPQAPGGNGAPATSANTAPSSATISIRKVSPSQHSSWISRIVQPPASTTIV